MVQWLRRQIGPTDPSSYRIAVSTNRVQFISVHLYSAQWAVGRIVRPQVAAIEQLS